jgi:hypothetical protein
LIVNLTDLLEQEGGALKCWRLRKGAAFWRLSRLAATPTSEANRIARLGGPSRAGHGVSA